MGQNKTCCERCGAQLYQDNTIWLELNCRTGTDHPVGTVPEDESQGVFPFGRGCAAILRKSPLTMMDGK